MLRWNHVSRDTKKLQIMIVWLFDTSLYRIRDTDGPRRIIKSLRRKKTENICSKIETLQEVRTLARQYSMRVWGALLSYKSDRTAIYAGGRYSGGTVPIFTLFAMDGVRNSWFCSKGDTNHNSVVKGI